MTRCRNCGVEIEAVVMPGIGPVVVRTIWFDPSIGGNDPDIYCDDSQQRTHEP